MDPAHIFTDNDISGSVFTRPWLDALLAAVMDAKRSFSVLVMMDASRLGRDMVETLPIQRKITRAGVRIFHYQDRKELVLETPIDELMASVANFGHADFRHQIRLKTRDALHSIHQQGYVAGGKVFGYENVRTGEHTQRRINPEQAAVVIRIFRLYAKGLGFRRLAHLLNAEAIPGPRGNAWAPTTLKALLANELYRGVVAYGDHRREQPDLQIVSDRQWNAVRARLSKVRRMWAEHRETTTGRLTGHPKGSVE